MKKIIHCLLFSFLALAPLTSLSAYRTTDYTANGYLPLHEHVLVSKANDGSEVMIECQSIFKVHNNDRYVARTWQAGDYLQLMENLSFFRDTRYKLYNKNTGEHIRVELALGPVKNTDHFKYIQAISDYRQEVTVLNQNGYKSVWKIQAGNADKLKKWKEGQAILIGTNADDWNVWFTGDDALLLDVERNETLRATRVE